MPKRDESLDLTCLKALQVDADAGRVALCAASIVVHAYAIARLAPDARADALRIVDLARRLYVAVPTRDAVAAIVDDSLAEMESEGADRRARARDRLVDRLFDHVHRGPERAPGRGSSR